MEKTNCLLDVVKNQLQNAISNIDAGNSNLNEEEMEELVKTLNVLAKLMLVNIFCIVVQQLLIIMLELE